MNPRVFLWVPLLAIAWAVLASLIYCLGYSGFSLRWTAKVFQPPYLQWFQAALWWNDPVVGARVSKWLIISGLAPLVLGGLMLLVRSQNGLGPRARRPFVGTWRQ